MPFFWRPQIASPRRASKGKSDHNSARCFLLGGFRNLWKLRKRPSWDIISIIFYIKSGPSPGFSSRGGQKPERGAKNQKGGHIFKIQCWMYAATGGPNVKWGAPISNGGPGTTGAPAGEDPASSTKTKTALKQTFFKREARIGRTPGGARCTWALPHRDICVLREKATLQDTRIFARHQDFLLVNLVKHIHC